MFHLKLTLMWAVKPNGEEYYCYMLVYVDDVLHMHHDPKVDIG